MMGGFYDEVATRSGQPLSACFQCGKCSGGCPSAKWYEYPNHKVIRMVQQGRSDELLAAKAPWNCVDCSTCGSRCPNDIFIGPVMTTLRQMSLETGGKPAEPSAWAFHKSFLNSIKRFGRIHEATMLAEYKLTTKDFFTDVGVGMKLFMKGRIPIMPSKIKDIGEVRKLFKAKSGEPSAEGGRS